MVTHQHGYIYVIEDTPNICKVGFTRKIPDKRVFQISCKYHREFKLKGYLETENFNRDEKIIHQFLHDYRLKGEWFKLSWEDIKEKCKQIEFYFHETEWYIKVKKFIHAADWHWSKEYNCWITREEAGYDEKGEKLKYFFDKKLVIN